MAHRVRQHKWENGILKTFDRFFNSAAEALGFAKTQDGNTVKVYDENNQLVESTNNTPTNTYA